MAYSGGCLSTTDALRGAVGDMGSEEVVLVNEHINGCRECRQLYGDQVAIVDEIEDSNKKKGWSLGPL